MAQYQEGDCHSDGTVRVLLADDNPAMLEATLRILEPEFTIVGTVGNGRDLLQVAAELQPDILVLDISMPLLSGLEAARLLKREGSNARIVFLTIHEDREFAEESFFVGAMGYVVKPRLAVDLPIAVREALLGRTFVSPGLSLPPCSSA